MIEASREFFLFWIKIILLPFVLLKELVMLPATVWPWISNYYRDFSLLHLLAIALSFGAVLFAYLPWIEFTIQFDEVKHYASGSIIGIYIFILCLAQFGLHLVQYPFQSNVLFFLSGLILFLYLLCVLLPAGFLSRVDPIQFNVTNYYVLFGFLSLGLAILRFFIPWLERSEF